MQMSVQLCLRASLFLIAAAVIYSGNGLLMVPAQISADLIAFSLLLDLAVWVPFLYYLLLARRGLAPAFVTKLLATSGVLTAFYWMPQQAWLATAKTGYLYVMLATGGVLFGIGAWRFVQAWRQSSHLSGEQRVVFLAEHTGRSQGLIKLMTLEWITVYYGTLGWGLRRQADNQNTFSYHQKSGAVGMIVGLSLFHIPGLIFTHIIFHNIEPVLATVLTVLHLYSMAFGLAHAMAMRNRFIAVSPDTLHLRNGLLMQADIAFNDIAEISRVSSLEVEEKTPGQIHLDFLGQANVLVTLKSRCRLPILMGLRKPCDSLVLALDEPAAFLRAVQPHLGN